MNYSIENIYKEFGQFDRVVTLSFFSNSKSSRDYPDYMTGTFFYTPKERRQMEDIIKGNTSTKGQIKFKEILNELSKKKKQSLIIHGINCEEISNIYSYSQINPQNEFKSEEIKKLPEPNIIEVTNDSQFDQDTFLLNFNKRRIANGYKLTPEETAVHKGVLLCIENGSIEQIEQEEDELKNSIKKNFLISRLRHKKANREDKEELNKIQRYELEQKISILRDQIKNAGIKVNDFETIKSQIVQFAPFLLEFSEKRLTHGKFPVWLNYERFLHMFIRHVNELNVGGNYDDKSKFRYLIDDILNLTELVLESINDEIQIHFKESSNKNFKRHGEMAVYYKGDYYVIDINPEGLLMTFYRR